MILNKKYRYTLDRSHAKNIYKNQYRYIKQNKSE